MFLEFLPDGAHRIGRGEDDPGVASVDQAFDGAFHLSRSPGRFHCDSGDLARNGPVSAQFFAHGSGLFLGAGDQDLPAVQRTRLPPTQCGAVFDASTNGEDDLPGIAKGGLHKCVHRGSCGVFGFARGVTGHGYGGVSGHATSQQNVAQAAQVGNVSSHREAAAVDGVSQHLRFQGGDVLNVDDSADRRRGHTGVDGHRLRMTHAWQHFKASTFGGGGFDFSLHHAVRVDVTHDETGHIEALFGVGGHVLGLFGGGGLHQADFGVVTGKLFGVIQNLLRKGAVVIDIVSTADRVESPFGQQPRVARASPDELHTAYQLTGTRHSVAPFVGCKGDQSS